VISRYIPPFNEQIRIESPGRLYAMVIPRVNRSIHCRPVDPRSGGGLGGADELPILRRQGVQVRQPESELYAYRAGEKSSEKVLDVGSRQVEVDVPSPVPILVQTSDAPTPAHAAHAIH
jgi:hypothetical protein